MPIKVKQFWGIFRHVLFNTVIYLNKSPVGQATNQVKYAFLALWVNIYVLYRTLLNIFVILYLLGFLVGLTLHRSCRAKDTSESINHINIRPAVRIHTDMNVNCWFSFSCLLWQANVAVTLFPSGNKQALQWFYSNPRNDMGIFYTYFICSPNISLYCRSNNNYSWLITSRGLSAKQFNYVHFHM